MATSKNDVGFAPVNGDEKALAGAPLLKHTKIKLYSRRFLTLALFGVSTLTNAMLWITFAPITSESMAFYGISTLEVNLLSICFMVLYLPGSLIASYVLERWGLRSGMVLATFMGMLCGWVRYLSVTIEDQRTAYAVLLLGQCIGALAQPMFTNAPAKIAGSWFPPKEREIATTVAAILNPVGNAIGSVLPAVLVPSPSHMYVGLIVEAIWATVAFVPVLFLFQSKPPTPPSFSASSRHVLRTQSLKAVLREGQDHESITSTQRIGHELKMLFTQRAFLALLVGFGVGLGLFNAMITVMAQLIAPCGYGSGPAGMLSGILIGSGLFGAAVAGPLMEKTKKYGPMLKIGIFFCIAGVTVFLIMLRPDNLAGLCVAAGVMGFCMIPLLPIVLENNAECTYPIPEETGSGVLLLNGQLFGVIFIFTLDKLIPLGDKCDNVASPAAILIWIVVGLAGGACLLYNGQYKRLEHERRITAAQGKGRKGGDGDGADDGEEDAIDVHAYTTPRQDATIMDA